MVWVATAIAGIGAVGSIIGGSNAADAATQAAQVQADSARYAAQIQAQIYNQTRNDLSPFVRAGQGALTNYSSLLPGGLDLGPSAPSTVLSGDSAGQDPNNPKTISVSDGAGGQIQIPNPSYDPSKPSGVTTPFALGAGASTPSPFLTNVESYIPGSGVAPNAALTGLNSLTPGSANPNPLLSAVNNFVPGGSSTPDASLTALRSLTPGGDSPLLKQVNDLLGLPSQSPSQVAGASAESTKAQQASVKQLSDQYSAAVKASGLSQEDFLASPAGKDFISQRNGLISTLTDPTALNQFTKGTSDAADAANARLTQLASQPSGGAQQGQAAAPGSIQSALENTPGYQFTLGQGLKSVQNSYASKGLANSGAAMKGAATYATGLSDATYEQRLNDYLNSYNSQYTNAQNSYTTQSGRALDTVNTQFANALNATNTGYTRAANSYGQQLDAAGNLLTLGSNAGAQTGSIGQATGTNIGNNLTGAGAATAAGIVGSSNATVNAINGFTGNALTAALYSQNNPSSSQSSTSSPYTPQSALGTKPTGIYNT